MEEEAEKVAYLYIRPLLKFRNEQKPLIIYMVNNKSCCSEEVIYTAIVLG